MPNKIVFICGSPGAGKSTILGMLSKQKKKYRVLNVGTLMTDLATKKGIVKDRDDLRFLPGPTLSGIQAKVFDKISAMNGTIILDTHATVEQNGRYLPGISIENVKHLHRLVGFAYIDSLTSDIEKRRKSDRTRRRENERPELIDVQRLINVSILSTCATYLNLPLFVVFNEQGKLNQSVKMLRTHLEKLYGA